MAMFGQRVWAAAPSNSCRCGVLVAILLIFANLGISQTFGYDESHILLAQRASTDTPAEDYEALWARGEYRKALKAAAERLALNDRYHNRVRHDLSLLHFQVGEIDEAIEVMKAAIEKDRQPAYYLKLAEFYEYRGQPLFHERAFADAAQAVQSQWWTSPRFWNYDENLAARGKILARIGNNPKNILSTFYDYVVDQLESMRRPIGPAIFVAAGDLSYRYGGYDIAAEYYERGLKADAENQDAMLGLAACYWKSNDRRFSEALQRLLDINPNHFEGNAIVVERLLEVGDTEAAYPIINRMLDINPVNHRFRSLKASAQFIDGDVTAMQATIDAVLDFNPIRSEVYRTVGRFASRHYRFREGAEFQRLALLCDPDDFEARGLYTLDLMRLGRETEGRVELERSFEANPYNVQLFNLLELMDTLETFEVVKEGAFVLKLPKAERPVMAEPALALLNEAITKYEEKYEVQLERPILIEMFDQHDDFMVRSVGLPGNAGHLGICFGKLVTMDAPSVRPRGSSNWRSVLWHEFVHVITLQKTKNRMPRWLSEGISVYEERSYSEAFYNRLDPEHKRILDHEGFPRIRDIDRFFTAPASGGHLMFGYFISAEFVFFYTETYGFESLVATLDRIRDGERTINALAAAAEASEEELDDAFREYLLRRTKPYENLPKVAQSQMPVTDPLKEIKLDVDRFLGNEHSEGKFAQAMKSARGAIEAGDWETAELRLREAHDLFPDYDGRDAPLRQLARVYQETEDDDKLLETLRSITYWTPNELEAALLLMDGYRDREDWAAVLDTAEWSIGIDPYDVELYEAQVEALNHLDRDADALSLYPVMLHLDPANGMDYRLREAELMTDLGRTPEAKERVVRLLEEAPHFWEAQSLLLAIVESPGPEDTVDAPPSLIR